MPLNLDHPHCDYGGLVSRLESCAEEGLFVTGVDFEGSTWLVHAVKHDGTFAGRWSHTTIHVQDNKIQDYWSKMLHARPWSAVPPISRASPGQAALRITYWHLENYPWSCCALASGIGQIHAEVWGASEWSRRREDSRAIAKHINGVNAELGTKDKGH